MVIVEIFIMILSILSQHNAWAGKCFGSTTPNDPPLGIAPQEFWTLPGEHLGRLNNVEYSSQTKSERLYRQLEKNAVNIGQFQGYKLRLLVVVVEYIKSIIWTWTALIHSFPASNRQRKSKHDHNYVPSCSFVFARADQDFNKQFNIRLAIFPQLSSVGS